MSQTPLTLVASLILVLSGACSEAGEPQVDASDAEAQAEPTSADVHIVDVRAIDYAFEAPIEIPAGWTTFRFTNDGQEHHFMLLTRLPEGKSIDDYLEEVVSAFGVAWEGLLSGEFDKSEAGQKLGEVIPDWYADVRFMGGPGLIAPGGVSDTTVKLEPGNYVIECYVKTAELKFHGELGMLRALTVTEEDSGGSPPDADLQIALSNTGIEAPSVVAAGEHAVAVRYQEHPEFGLGNDVHVVKVDENTVIEDVANWMDWMNVEGLAEPAPAEFVGGAQEMPVGSTSYFSLSLEPGRYLWISERPAEQGMIAELMVE